MPRKPYHHQIRDNAIAGLIIAAVAFLVWLLTTYVHL